MTLLIPDKVWDERGYFARVFSPHDLAPAGIEFSSIESGISVNRRKGTVRGLHWQRAPYAQAKIVACTRGRIFDVVVDLRPNSPTFGRWQSFELDADRMARLYVDCGFAHGFQSLEDDTEVLYEMSNRYAPDLAATLRYNDPALAIPWPLDLADISRGDAAAPMLKDLDLTN